MPDTMNEPDATPRPEPPVPSPVATPAGERIAALDVLRGVALLLIFLVNLPFLALSSATSMSPAAASAARLFSR